MSEEMPINFLVDRVILLNLFRILNFKVGAEIGTAEGFFAERICQFNPQLKLFVVDKYKAYKEYADYTQEMSDKCFAEMKKRMGQYNYEHIKLYSMEALEKFKDNSLDFAYIDANHDYKYVLEDIGGWIKKVRPGGIIAGHDYSFRFGVKEAVVDYTKRNKISPWFVLGDDGYPSWFWIK